MFDFDYGSYAPYIWSAFAITGAVLGWMVVDSLTRARRWKREAEQRGRGEEA